ncbi:MAG: D-amino-acid transaminase [Proteobacteria bacterium]|nr:D-amino-acid transaminase [Pseudomonadota bacterium]
MSRIVYVNGEYLSEDQAKISVFDRGFLFADGVYEVSAVIAGKLIDNAAHLKRLERSMKELRLTPPATMAEIEAIENEMVRRNDVDEGLVYMQVTRGAADRDFAFPKDAQPTLVMFTQKKNLTQNPLAEKGIAIISMPEIRWQRRDIKSVGLLASSLAKQAAIEAGVGDAWFIEDGFVTEGTSNNAFIVTDAGKIVTRHLGNEILPGITRKAVMELAKRENIEIEERPFTIDEAYESREAFLTSASVFVMPVIKIDGHVLGNGVPGPVTVALRKLYLEMAKAG